MKHTLILLLLISILTACGRRNPNLSEKQLAALMADTVKTGVNEGNTAFTGANDAPPQAGVKYTEDRKVDPSNPPVVINFTGNIETQNTKLGNIASSIRIIKLQFPDSLTMIDEVTFRFARSQNIRLYKDKIIVDLMRGIYIFSSDGKLIENIYYNNTVGVENTKRGNEAIAMIRVDSHGGRRTCIIGNTLIYRTKVDDSDGESPVVLTYYDLDKMQKVKTIQLKNRDQEGIFAINDNTIVYKYHTLFTKHPYILQSFGINGDTLCRFSFYEKIVDFKAGSYARPEPDIIYNFNKQLTFRQSCSDTLFRMPAPNRLLPIYILQKGKYHLDINDAVRNKTDEKIFIDSWIETDKYIIIDYHYTVKNERKQYKSLFNKIQKRLTNLPEGQTVFENNLSDDVPFFVPEMVVETGEMAMHITHTSSSDYMIKKEPKNAEKLKPYCQTLNNNEMVIILAK